MPPVNGKLSPPSLAQIKNCKDKKKLSEYRQYLMDNVQRLVTENYIEWSVWDQMICQIDNQIDGTPITMYIPPGPGEVKGRKI